MSSIHRIRLRGSWEVTIDGDRTQHSRKFGQPRSNGEGERIWLVCDSVGPAEVLLNGQSLGVVEVPGPFAADVTALLGPRNLVVFAVNGSGPLGEVAVEIRSGAS